MFNLYQHHIFFDKVINQITHQKNKLWLLLPASRISLSGLSEIPERSLLKKQLESVVGDVVDVVSQISNKDQRVILDSADQTLNHQFDYLGSGLMHMPKIRWHDDFKTGFSWKKGVYYLKQRSYTKKGADIKVPWELSRCHHLLWLGEAYLITKEEKYAKEVVDEIEDWWAENPFLYSVNWTCTMDVAIRSVNWMYAVCMVLDSSVVSDEFVSAVYKSLYQHGWYIYNNLERSIPHSNNHLFSDLAGLLFLAFLFKDTKRGGKWLKYTKTALYEEIRCQILPSGAQYERSVSYHRLMTEMVAASILLLKRQNETIPADIDYRMSSMFSFIEAYTKPNGLAPLIEDNDDGRFLPFIKRDFRDHSYLLKFTSAEMLFYTNAAPSIKYWYDKRSLLLSDAGHAIIRKDDAYLFITNGGFSKYEEGSSMRGTHTHNDRLSFELAIGEEDVIIDPGSYVYTPEPQKCIEFKSTYKHNTVCVDGEEQNFLMPDNVFLQKKNSVTTAFNFNYDGSVFGEYVTLSQKFKHKRVFELFEKGLIIRDILTKSGLHHSAVLSYHLAPDVLPLVHNSGFSLETSCFDIEMDFCAEGVDFQKKILDDTCSPSYGVLKSSKTIQLCVVFDERIIIETTIKWKEKN